MKDFRPYDKGDFRGILFVKYATKDERDVAIKLLTQARCKEGGYTMWAKPDKPVEKRVVQSLVFGAKFIMVEWKWNKKCI